MTTKKESIWQWEGLQVSWSQIGHSKSTSLAIVLIHGLKDNVVKEGVPRKILKKITGKNVNIIYLKESDHRLSSETDLRMITQSIDYIRSI